MRKWQRIAAVTTASAMTVQLAACGTGSEGSTIEEIPTITYVEEEIIVEPDDTTGADDTTGDDIYDTDGELVDIYESDYMDACDDWYEDEDGSFVCEDEASPYYQNHFFDGVMYATIGAMVASSFYKNKNRVNGVKYTNDNQGSSGGGAGYSGGSNAASKNAGVTTTPNNNTPANTNVNDAGTTKPSNGSSSYNSGKSGFSSGGASRGGSSSS